MHEHTHRQNKSSGKPTTRSPGHSSEGIQHPRKAMRTRLNTTSSTRTRKQKLRAATQQNDSKPYQFYCLLCTLTLRFCAVTLASMMSSFLRVCCNAERDCSNALRYSTAASRASLDATVKLMPFVWYLFTAKLLQLRLPFS